MAKEKFELVKKDEFIERLVKESDISKEDIEKVLKGLTNVVIDVIKENKQVALNGLGTFKPKNSPSRTKECALHGEKRMIDIPAKRTITFSKSSTSTKILNQ